MIDKYIFLGDIIQRLDRSAACVYDTTKCYTRDDFYAHDDDAWGGISRSTISYMFSFKFDVVSAQDGYATKYEMRAYDDTNCTVLASTKTTADTYPPTSTMPNLANCFAYDDLQDGYVYFRMEVYIISYTKIS